MVKQECVEELLRLIKENPELPVVPMVDSEVVADDCGYWMGSLQSAMVDEYFLSKRAERYFFKSDDDVFDVLEMTMSAEEFDALPENDEECRPYYDRLPWKKAILVYIGLPEPE